MIDSERHFRHMYFDRFGQHISLEPELLSRIGVDFMLPKLATPATPQRGYRVQKVEESLLADPHGRRIPNAGCELPLQLCAFNAGILLSPSIQSTPISRLSSSHLPEQTNSNDLPRFVSDFERGLIRIPKSCDRAPLICELARAFPESRLIVLSGHVAPLQKLCDSLRELLPPEYLAHQGMAIAHSRRRLNPREDEELPKIILCTFTETADLDFAQADLVIFLNADECTQERARVALEQPDLRFRLFGFINHGQDRSPYQRGLLSATFGFHILDLNSRGRVRREINVGWVVHRSSKPLVRSAERPLDLRHDYIENHHRNDRISRLAKSLSRVEPEAQGNAKSVSEWIQTHPKAPLSITILVERLDHAIALSGRLQNWPIIGGKSANLNGLSGRIRRRIQRGPQQWLDGRRQIVLIDSARDFRGGHTDVIIWAGGGESCRYLPSPWLFQSESATRGPLLLIDFVDRFHSEALEASERRKIAYRDCDIFPVGISASEGRVYRFINEFGNYHQ